MSLLCPGQVPHPTPHTAGLLWSLRIPFQSILPPVLQSFIHGERDLSPPSPAHTPSMASHHPCLSALFPASLPILSASPTIAPLSSSDTLLRLIPETCPESSFHQLLYKLIPPWDSLLALQASGKFHCFLGTDRISSRAGSLQLPNCTKPLEPPAGGVFMLLPRTAPARSPRVPSPGLCTQRALACAC